MPSELTEAQRLKILNLYEKEVSQRHIANELGISREAIATTLKRHGSQVKECPECGRPFNTIIITKRFCSPKCRRIFNNLKMSHRIKEDLEYHKAIRGGQRRRYRERYAQNQVNTTSGRRHVSKRRPKPNSCEVCGCIPRRFEWHHKGKLENGVWVCRHCHTMAERIDRGCHLVYLKLMGGDKAPPA